MRKIEIKHGKKHPWVGQPNKRTCLKCSKIFKSDGPHMRICDICKNNPIFSGLEERIYESSESTDE